MKMQKKILILLMLIIINNKITELKIGKETAYDGADVVLLARWLRTAERQSGAEWNCVRWSCLLAG
jgi:hypothetical protein